MRIAPRVYVMFYHVYPMPYHQFDETAAARFFLSPEEVSEYLLSLSDEDLDGVSVEVVSYYDRNAFSRGRRV